MDSHTTQLTSAIDYIHEMDLSFVADRVVKTEGWSRKDAQLAVAQYKNFLILHKKYPDHKLVPSAEIDEIWHAHLLHTKEYRGFCKIVFAHCEDAFLDHSPEISNPSNQELMQTAFLDTRRLYLQNFGEDIYAIINPWLCFFRKLLSKIKRFVTGLFRFSKNDGNAEYAY